MGAYEVAKARFRTSAGAEPRTTFEKSLSILKGEVFSFDKDLLMGADHEEASSTSTAGVTQIESR